MPQQYEATARRDFHISVTCENCGHQYSYDHPYKISITGGSRYWASKIAQDDMQRAINDYRYIVDTEEYSRWGWWHISGRWSPIPHFNRRTGLGWKTCPECNYTQSWMVHTKKASRASKIVILISLLIVLFWIGYALTQGDSLDGFSSNDKTGIFLAISCVGAFGLLFAWIIYQILYVFLVPMLSPFILVNFGKGRPEQTHKPRF